VLLADDLAAVRAAYGAALRLTGFDVQEAYDGVDAVEKAIMLRPAVIVLDYVMPRMDGGQAFRVLSSHPRTRTIPVVLLSAFAAQVPADARFGCATFVAKPPVFEQQALADLCTLIERIVATSTKR
jgi:CheY-like chemotaxis protein